jgi:hypothetical protein
MTLPCGEENIGVTKIMSRTIGSHVWLVIPMGTVLGNPKVVGVQGAHAGSCSDVGVKWQIDFVEDGIRAVRVYVL